MFFLNILYIIDLEHDREYCMNNGKTSNTSTQYRILVYETFSTTAGYRIYIQVIVNRTGSETASTVTSLTCYCQLDRKILFSFTCEFNDDTTRRFFVFGPWIELLVWRKNLLPLWLVITASVWIYKWRFVNGCFRLEFRNHFPCNTNE